MKKRKNKSSSSQASSSDIERFKDNDDNYNTTKTFDAHDVVMMHSQGAANNNNNDDNNGSGGMSRAAKKRAKKRAKINTATDSAAAAAAAAAAESSTSAIISTAMIDNDGVGDGNKNLVLTTTNNNNVDVLSSSKKKKKKKKKKKSSEKNNGNDKEQNEEEINAFAMGDTSLLSKKSEAASYGETAEEDDNDVDLHANDNYNDDDSDDEMEPELEALLSTLTPMQILLLNADENEKQKSAAAAADDNDLKMSSTNSNSHKIEDSGTDVTNDPLSGINPQDIINDITTQHRAKILLSSLISPSDITVMEFYDTYWGKRPLLACYDDERDNDDEEEDMITTKKEMMLTSNKNKQQQHEKHTTRLNGFLNRSIINDMIQKNKLRYGLDLNVTRYTDTMGDGLRHRITLDPPPKKRKSSNNKGSNSDDDNIEYIVANPTDIWSNVDTSHCTLRLLRPHEHNDNIHTMLSLLESEFGCMVGSNAYLTPLNSQGFAPHYDDVDVFILQLVGYKRWRVYSPLNKREMLPRSSSRDYTEKEMDENGEEYMDVVLCPGDVLYLPRGWIHQAETVCRPKHIPKLSAGGSVTDDDHSLHLTVSAMQNWCWADFLELLMPEALESAAMSDKSTSLREGLPRNFSSYMGTMHQVDEGGGRENNLPEGLKQVAEAQAKAATANGSEDVTEEDEEAIMEARARQRTLVHQKQFKDEAKKRIMRVCKQAMSMLDDACDQMGKRFMSDRLPPALLEPERCLTKEALSDNNTAAAAHHHDAAKKIWPNTLCRLARPNIARLVIEGDKAVLYHCLDNSRVFRGTPLSPMEFEVDDAPALEQLLTTVEPHWIMVKDLIHGDVEDKMDIAQALFDEGILSTMLVENPDRSVQTG